MLTSQGNMYAGLGSVAAAALLSIPFGFGIGSLPLIAFAAGELIASMFIPDLITFQDSVDKKFRVSSRENSKKRLLEEIQVRVNKKGMFDQTFKTWSRMTDRVNALYRHAADTSTNLPLIEIEKLDDATIEFLCIWLARLVIEDRAESINMKDIQERIAGIDRELTAARSGVDVRQLQKARAEYVAMVERYRRMLSRKTAIDAALLSMPDQLEEIFQTIMTTPLAEGIGSRLEESIEKLRLQEDIDAELSEDLEAALPGVIIPSQRTAANGRQIVRSRVAQQ